MGPISTQGWDTAYVLRLSKVNAAIKAAIDGGKLVLPPIAWQSDDKLWSMTGSFGAWQLTSEGMTGTGGPLVNMRFLIKDATLTGLQNRTIKDVTAIGTVQLGLLSSGPLRRFGIDPREGVRLKSVPGIDTYFRAALESYLSNHLESFSPVFATIDFNSKIARTAPWLAPKAVGYCYQGGRDDDSSYLGLLCMTDGFVAGNPTPPSTLSSDLIPAGADCAFLMSRRLFVKNLLLPGIVDGFKLRIDPAAERSLEPSALAAARARFWFDIKDDGARIVKRNKTPRIHLRKTKADMSWLYGAMAGGLINPWTAGPTIFFALLTFVGELIGTGKPAIMGELDLWIDGLEVKAASGEITITAALVGHLKLPILRLGSVNIATVRLSVTTSHKLCRTSDGKFHLQSARSLTHTEPKIEIAKWISDGGKVSKIILEIVGAIVTVATEGVALVLIGIELALITAGLEFLPKALAMSAKSAAESGAPISLDGFVDAAISPVAWTGNSGLAPTSVAFDQALLIGGNSTTA